MINPSLAYKYVVIAAWLAEINFCCRQLHLKQDLPVVESDIRDCAIFGPQPTGFLGRIDTTDYSYCFGRNGGLRFIERLDWAEREHLTVHGDPNSVGDVLTRMSHLPSIVTTNDACRLATYWLQAVDVDLDRLQREKHVHVEQQRIINDQGGFDLVPLFYVIWGPDRDETIDVMISGINGELLSLRQEDDAYFKRPAMVITNIDRLMAIPDAEFLKYSPLERSNLVARFSNIQCLGTGLLPASVTNATSLSGGR
jgi:hypothetical protein